MVGIKLFGLGKGDLAQHVNLDTCYHVTATAAAATPITTGHQYLTYHRLITTLCAVPCHYRTGVLTISQFIAEQTLSAIV